MTWFKIVKKDILNEVIKLPDNTNGLLIVEPCRLANIHIIGGITQIVIRAPSHLENITLENFGGDGIIISSSNCYLNNIYGRLPADFIDYDKLHPDFIQLIAIDKNGKPDTNGILENITIDNPVLYAPYIPEKNVRGIQGITGFDCIVRNIKINSPKIITDFDQHGISFNSAENCIIDNAKIDSCNTDKKVGIVLKDRKGLSKGFNNKILNSTVQLLDVEEDTIIDNTILKKIEHDCHEVKVDNMYKSDTNLAYKDHMQIAYLEAAKDTKEYLGAEFNKEIEKYWSAVNYKATDDSVPWCAAFVNYVLKEAGIPRTESPAAMSFKKWGVETKAKIGCIVVIPRGDWKGHVGFLAQEDSQYYYILGGNQNNEVNVSKFEKSKHTFYFRWHKQLKGSSTFWVELFKTATGISITGATGNEIISRKNDIQKEPDTGHEDIIETTPSIVKESFSVPDGYILIPDVILYGTLIIGAIYTIFGLYVIKERNNKIKEYGI